MLTSKLLWKQLTTLTTLELRNLYGLNVLRFTKDAKAKRRTLALAAAIALVFLMLLSYVGGLSYGLIFLGLSEVVPAYLITICSIIIFFFGIFKAGSLIFHQNGYDILCSLPVTRTAIVLSRILRMYVENLILTTAVLLPGLGVYLFLIKPGSLFGLMSLLTIFILPIAPMAGAILIGAMVTGISSRMKHKSLMTTALSLLAVLALILGSSRLSTLENSITPELLKELSGTITALLEQLYPPAIWLGNAIIQEDFGSLLLCAGLFLGILGIVSAVVSASFLSICRSLYSTSAKHNYQMQHLQKNSVLATLCKKELKRYFASSIYVTNTIMGPILGTVLCGAFLFVDLEQITGQLPFTIHMTTIAPFLMATVFCTMTTTTTAISMEGKNWWIAKSLPLTAKNILDAKILMNLIVILPFYLLSEVLLMLALRPSILELLWLFLVPACIILFSCVFGITINLILPVFNWENEIRIVKQSASAAIGGFGGTLVGILCMVLTAVVPGEYTAFYNFGICIVILGITGFLYQRNNQVNLQSL